MKALTNMADFTGHTVVITGGAGVLGGRIACALASCRANEVILDQNPECAQAILAQIGTQREAAFFACDVLSREALDSTAEKIAARFGKVDSLINAAGGNNPKATTVRMRRFLTCPRRQSVLYST